jgi:serine/threonine protein kinase
MEDAKHPFIIDLKYAFEAEKYIVFVLEYCAGGELFGLIKKYRRLSEEMARFYII